MGKALPILQYLLTVGFGGAGARVGFLLAQKLGLAAMSSFAPMIFSMAGGFVSVKVFQKLYAGAMRAWRESKGG